MKTRLIYFFAGVAVSIIGTYLFAMLGITDNNQLLYFFALLCICIFTCTGIIVSKLEELKGSHKAEHPSEEAQWNEFSEDEDNEKPEQ
ncbi:MAG: hypothetical protein ACI3VB_08030 [Oscillospiraceae bacterium]